MIRAVVRNGIIQPLEPLPADWQEGHPVAVNEFQEIRAEDKADLDRWLEDMKRLTEPLNNLQEWQEIEATLAAADQQSKQWVRREMGLP